MPNMSPRNVMRLAAVVVAVALSVGFLAGRAAFAEEVPGDAGKGKSASAESISGGKVTEAERLKFQQSAAAAQMQELQDRMFRLAELTRQAEPDDAAKLLLAVHRAREQLIIEQMKEIQDRIGSGDLGKTLEEQKEVLIKLEELKKLLLATDLDLQMKLEMLRKIQQSMDKLDAAIKEEQRQQEQTGQFTEQQKKETKLPENALNNAQQEQQKNRQATDQIAQTMKELGQAGAKAGESLGGACQSMSQAEGSLGGGKPGDAQPKQGDAVKQMQEARAELDRQRQKLLEEIERAVRGQVIANLGAMLERQQAVRGANERLAPKLAAEEGGREAVLRLKQLARPEETVANIARETIRLIEETQFSVALPPAIGAIERQVLYVVADLQAGRGDQKVIDAEKQIEKDIQDLIDTMKEAQSMASTPSECKGCKQNKNKLLAELKVLRMLQLRVNTETKDADGRRALAEAELAPELRDRIGTVRDHQAQVRDTTEKIHKSVCPECLKEE
jgi:hypothetical protein